MSPTEPLLLVCLVLLMRQTWRGARRRTALNRALHEIRRPLQALALSTPHQAATGVQESSPVWQAISAVGQLDRELNGFAGDEALHEPVAMRLMTEACVRRAAERAELAGAKVRLRWAGTDALVLGDGAALSGALENLILNAIEHGGPDIVVNATVVLGHLRLEVIDSGWRRNGGGGRPSGKAGAHRFRHGHGLVIAGRVAAAHGGRIDRDFSENGSRVTMVLPLEEPRSGVLSAARTTEARIAC